MREKTNLTLHPTVKKSALDLAASQGRSLSELVERLLERELEYPPQNSYGASLKEEHSYTAPSQYSKARKSTCYKAKKSSNSIKQPKS